MQEEWLQVERSARYFTSGCDVGKADSVWIVLHGYAQLADEFAKGIEPFLGPGDALVAPEGLSRFYTKGGAGNVGASWMTKIAREREIEDYINYLDLVHLSFASMAQAKLHVLGFSQGAATAVRWALRGKIRPNSLTLWGADFPPDVDCKSAALKLKDCALYAMCGESDQYVSLDEHRLHFEKIASSGLNFERIEFKGGHEITADAFRTLAGRLA